MPAKNKDKCEVCGKKTIVSLAYGPHYFCEKHFIDFFESRFRKTIRKYSLIKPREKILVALSGGKDSTVTLYLLKKFYEKSNEIEALIIDEGVKGYRNKAIYAALENCKKLGIKSTIVCFKDEFGITNDELMPMILSNPKLGGTCAFCGTLRRNIMNKYAKKLKADKLVTGHNLDDEVQSFVMNVFNNEFDRMRRMGAEAGIIKHKGFVKRIKPLYETPEKEIIAYCIYKKINHYSEECCPYSWTAKRNEYREMLNNFETRFPGTQYSILRFYEMLKISLKPINIKHEDTHNSEKNKSTILKECNICSEPTERDLCKACEMIEKIKTIQAANSKQKKQTKKEKNKKYNKNLTCHNTKRRN
jgi:uncharacterized protein (TIGR00269 family)